MCPWLVLELNNLLDTNLFCIFYHSLLGIYFEAPIFRSWLVLRSQTGLVIFSSGPCLLFDSMFNFRKRKTRKRSICKVTCTYTIGRDPENVFSCKTSSVEYPNTFAEYGISFKNKFTRLTSYYVIAASWNIFLNRKTTENKDKVIGW